MNSEQLINAKCIANSIEDYIDSPELEAVMGDSHSCWIIHEKFSAQRFPEYILDKPDYNEIIQIFKKLKCLLVGYTIIPDDKLKVNAYLYECRDKSYDIDKLESSSVRRNIRYGRRNLKYGFTDWDDILMHGLKAFSDTRRRVGLSDGVEKNFNKRFLEFSKNKYHKAVAAWLQGQIIGFMSLIVVNKFVIIQGTFSIDEHKKYRPNNVLVDFVLKHFLVENGFNIVSYGLSSIQEEAEMEGLHNFKTSVGFNAIPAQRVFLLNPILSILKLPIKLVIHFLKILLPRNRFVRKASGIFNYLE